MSSKQLLDAWIHELDQIVDPSLNKNPSSNSSCSAVEYVDKWIASMSPEQKTKNKGVAADGNNIAEKRSQKNTKEAKPEKSKKGETNNVDVVGDIHAGHLELRVGKLVKVWEHPESDKLFCEEIDIGEGTNRLIASGLRAFYKQEDLQGRECIVLANLKPKKMGGFASNGMVMCASNDAHDKVLLIEPPKNAPIGSLVSFDGFPLSPMSSAQEKKKKIFEHCAPFFKVGEAGVCQFRGIDFNVEGFGKVSVPGAAPGYSIS